MGAWKFRGAEVSYTWKKPRDFNPLRAGFVQSEVYGNEPMYSTVAVIVN